ncbi:hypothetical protein BRETT_004188 [Brettanomyces bruxellensis]|uniref:Uncharacterized protein n=1 Tax=Dekkera bruxellensis TaxID=5007 RepID=A0A871QZ31_DEKBR|nr:uncharacterized protein BRETT_004188 [Brettanomyces bruxellensis]QOU18967.1 hypothetical protein BRETT_004188 [Brettanomyces bruxellensis]
MGLKRFVHRLLSRPHRSRRILALLSTIVVLSYIGYFTKQALIYIAAAGPGITQISGNGASSGLFGKNSNVDDSTIMKYLNEETLSDKQVDSLISYFGFDPSDIKAIQHETLFQVLRSKLIDLGKGYDDWTKIAYVQYATDIEHICPAIINFQRLKEKQAEADFVFLYAGNQTSMDNIEDNERRLLRRIEATGATIKYVNPIAFSSSSSEFDKSYTMLYAFALTEYRRVVFLDSESLVLQNMDELFSLPDSILAATVDYNDFRNFKKIKFEMDDAVLTPYDRATGISEFYDAYIKSEQGYSYEWMLNKIYPELPSMKVPIELLDSYKLKYKLANHILVIHPNKKVFETLLSSLRKRADDERDLDVLNDYFDLSRIVRERGNYFKIQDETSSSNAKYIPLVQIIPHNPFALLSNEFRQFQRAHDCYLADPPNLLELGYNYPALKYTESVRTPIGTLDDEESDSFVHPEIPYWSWYWNRQITTYGWGAKSILDDAKFVYFSDVPMPKPWVRRPSVEETLYQKAHAECLRKTHDNFKDCEKEILVWTKLYDTYTSSVEDYC